MNKRLEKPMRNALITFLAMFSFQEVVAQPPALIPYQAIARDAAGNAVLNQNIGLRFSIHDQTITGTIVWQEAQTVLSGPLGVVVTSLGSVSDLSSVNWANGYKFLQVEMDVTGGTNYTEIGTQQMMSVPYALYAATAGNNTPGPQGPIGLTGPQGSAGANGLNSLIKTAIEPSGLNCVNGGIKIETGLDADSNGVLDVSEIDSSQTQFLCNPPSNNSNTQTALGIGDYYDGGLIGYILQPEDVGYDQENVHGLIVALNAIAPMTFGCFGIFANSTGTELGQGQNNTNTILSACNSPLSAAYYCDNLIYNGKTDWFLPSRQELEKISQFGSANISYPFGSASYISSTEVDANRIYIVTGNGSVASSGNKQSNASVMPVRYF
jgi:hypothetical protein